MTTVRLQKILARGGISSRRAAERLITEGRVRVNGKVVNELGSKADPYKDKIELDGKKVIAEQAVYIVMHKPRGVVSTLSDPEGRPTVKELMKTIDARVFPVGRLDFATSGVLLATNDGDFSDALLHPRKSVPKTYVVKVQGKMEREDLERWRTGVELEDGITRPAEAGLVRYEGDKTWFTLTIKEGRNQQVRRMGEATGFRVMRLSRTSFANVTGEGLKPGAWRYLTREELVTLKKIYGVPKKVPVIPEEPSPGRSTRTRERPSTRTAPRTNSKGGAPAKAPRGNSPRGNSPRGEASRTEGARYGGGAPGRRSVDTRDDWGGGVSRGGRSSSSRDDAGSTEAPRRGSSGRPSREQETTTASRDIGRGGRFGPTRTTGTGGGVHAKPGDHERGPRVGGRPPRRK